MAERDTQQMKHVISLGAGVQSSTMALMAAAGEITPMPDCAIFAGNGKSFRCAAAAIRERWAGKRDG